MTCRRSAAMGAVRLDGLLLAFFLIAVRLASAAGPIVEPLTSADKGPLVALFNLQKDGSYGCLRETYEAATVFAALDSFPADPSTTFTYLKDVKPQDTEAAFYAIGAAAALKHPEAQLTGQILAASEGLSKGTTLDELYHGAVGLATAKKAGWLKRNAVDKKTLQGAVKKLQAFVTEDGTWRSVDDDSDGTALASGKGLEAVAALVELGLGTNEAGVQEIKGSVEKLVQTAESAEDGFVYFDAQSGSPLLSTAAVAKGALALSAALGESLAIVEKLPGIAQYLLASKSTSSPELLSKLVDALSAISSNSFSVPLIVCLAKSSLSLNNNDKLEVSVTTPLGAPVSAPITLKRAKRAGAENAIFTNELLEGGAFDFLASKPAVGKYVVVLEVEAPEKYSVASPIKKEVRVVGSATVSDVTLTVADEDGSKKEHKVPVSKNGFKAAQVSVTQSDKLGFKFKVSGPEGAALAPQQTFVRLAHSSGVDTLFAAKGSDGQYSFELSPGEISDKLFHLSGAYTLELIVGDFFIDNSLHAVVANLDLKLPPVPEGAAAPPADTSEDVAPPAEIAHIFRQPDKRPPATVSLLFTALSVVPLVGLLIGFSALGVSFKGFPSSGPARLSAVLFHAGIAAIAGLYFLFWLRLNLFQVLGALVPLSVFTAFTGHFILSSLADSKVKTA